MSGISPLDLENPFSREEDEDVEEQKRREAELQDLLAVGFQEFNYDDNESTMNSSSTSIETTNYNKSIVKDLLNSRDQTSKNFKYPTNDGDHLEAQYKNANADQHEQLKVLYEIRQREAKKLNEELEKCRSDKTKEITAIKSQMLLMEGEIQQLKLGNNNLGSLLEEKTRLLRQRDDELKTKDQEVKILKKHMTEMNVLLGSYESQINELQLKLSDDNPFGSNVRAENAKIIQKNHEDQYDKMESLIQDQALKLEGLLKENAKLKEEITTISLDRKKSEEDNTYALMSLAKKYQHCQEQCKNLFALGEAVKQESDHFKERLRQVESNQVDSLHNFNETSLDKESLMRQFEQMKRLLYDQTIEMNTLQTKLKTYNSDCNELFHYRKILNEISGSEIQACSNSDHSDLILFLRKQLQSYEQAIEDRNKQIISLNSLNKDLHERIEEMIAQTRNDIQNISQRYSLPQLETMSNELKIAQQTIIELNEQLKRKPDDKGIAEKLKKLKQENDQLKQELQQVTKKFEYELAKLNEDLSNSKIHLNKLQILVETSQKAHLEVEKENATLTMKLKETISNLDSLTKDLNQCQQSTLKDVSTLIKKIRNCFNRSRDGMIENFELNENLMSWIGVLEKLKGSISSNLPIECCEEEAQLEEEDLFKYRIELLTQELKQANVIINELNGKHRMLLRDADNNSEIIKSLKEKINELNEQLSDAELSPTSNNKEIYFAETASTVSQDVENKKESDELKEKILQELKVREQQMKEHEQKLEQTYRKILKKKTEHFEKEKEQWQDQETAYRQNLVKVLQECGNQIKQLETENNNLLVYNRQLGTEFQTYKNSVQNKENVLLKATHKHMITNQKWSDLIQSCSTNIKNVDKHNQLRIKNLMKKITVKENEIRLLEDVHQDKVNNFKKIYRTMPQ